MNWSCVNQLPRRVPLFAQNRQFERTFWCPGRDSNPHGLSPEDFKSPASTIPPPGLIIDNTRFCPYVGYTFCMVLRAP